MYPNLLPTINTHIHENSLSLSTTQTTVAFCRTWVVAHCGPTPMTCGSSSCREHVNSVIEVSRPPVLDCGTTFHLDYGGRDLPSATSDNLWTFTYLATEALSDSFECIDVELCISPVYRRLAVAKFFKSTM